MANEFQMKLDGFTEGEWPRILNGVRKIRVFRHRILRSPQGASAGDLQKPTAATARTNVKAGTFVWGTRKK